MRNNQIGIFLSLLSWVMLATSAVADVSMDNATSKLKIKGRFGAGVFQSGTLGTDPFGSFQIPEGKVMMSYQVDDVNTVVLRFNANSSGVVGAAPANNFLDFMYLDSKLPFGIDSRLGRFKVQYGEETLYNNIVESSVIGNSVSGLSGNDEGVQLSGKLSDALKWNVSATNGNRGVVADNNGLKAYSGKISYQLDALYLSGSYYQSGGLTAVSTSEMSFAGNTGSLVGGASNWDRSMAELDVRFDFGRGKVANPPAFTDSVGYVWLAYGNIADTDVSTAKVSAIYGFVEGLYNLTPQIFSAARYSQVDVANGGSALLNSFVATAYKRTSVALGYRFTPKTHFKLGYDINTISLASGAANPDANQLSAVVVTTF